MIRSPRAATLVELLVVIAIAATLTTLMIPALRQLVVVRKDLLDLSNLRQTMIDFHGYAAAHRDRVVNIGHWTETGTEWYYSSAWGQPQAVNIYRGQGRGWNLILSRWTGPNGPHWHSAYEDFLIEHPLEDGPVHASTMGDRMHLIPTRYVLSKTMRTQPHIWTYPGAGLSIEEFAEKGVQVVRFSDIASPSRKGVLLHMDHPRWEKNLSHVAFADGAAALKNMDEAIPAAAPPLHPRREDRGTPVLSTLNGHQGIDF